MKKKNSILVPILVFMAFVLGAAWSFLTIKQLSNNNSPLSQVIGTYTVNENSISGAVDKVYVATVTVINNYNGKHES